jgi:hypothetical protein
MDTSFESAYVRFQLPVRWDIATRVLKHAARNGRARLEIQRTGNGYLRLQRHRAFRPAIAIDVLYLAELESATIVLVADVTRGPRLTWRDRQRIEALIDQFRSDAEFFASHLHALDDHEASQESSPWVDRLQRLRRPRPDKRPQDATDLPADAALNRRG